jgi:hypothetical protein
MIAVLQRSDESAIDAYSRAARVLGFVHARLAAMGAVRGNFLGWDLGDDRASAALNKSMSEVTAARLMAEGGLMTEDVAVGEALAS